MIVRIENAEQEKYVLAQAEIDGLKWKMGESPFEYIGSENNTKFPFGIGFDDHLIVDAEFNITHTFQEFKQSREESKLELTNEVMAGFTPPSMTLEQMNKLKDVLIGTMVSVGNDGYIYNGKEWDLRIKDNLVFTDSQCKTILDVRIKDGKLVAEGCENIEKLQAENEELKEVIKKVSDFCTGKTTINNSEYSRGIEYACDVVIKILPKTPTQKKALEIIEANEKEVIEEVVRVFKTK